MHVPLTWVKGCEALMKQVRDDAMTRSIFGKKKSSPQSFTVIAQGGLAPVGLLLASRNPQTVDRLILTSPPTYQELITAVPEKELARNYNFLQSPVWGRLAFSLLETRGAVEFFSNAFLFDKPCDATWLERVKENQSVDVRPPVQVFNAGFCQHRSYQDELTTLRQPLLILQGQEDKPRLDKRRGYAENVPDCKTLTLPGKNVLPWESAVEVMEVVKQFCGY
jgi:pimeloyl-ACP methyl ester carboxylesterase